MEVPPQEPVCDQSECGAQSGAVAGTWAGAVDIALGWRLLCHPAGTGRGFNFVPAGGGGGGGGGNFPWGGPLFFPGGGGGQVLFFCRGGGGRPKPGPNACRVTK